MSRPRVSATSEPVGEADTRRRDLAWQILRASNEPVVGFAKLMVPTSLSASGAIIALAQAGGRLAAGGEARAMVLAGCGLCLLAMLLFAWVVYARPIRVSAEDYQDVLEELLRAASARHRATTLGLAALTLGAALAILAFAVPGP